MIGLRIDSREVTGNLSKAIASCEAMTIAMEQTASLFTQKITSEFQSQTDPYGQTWDPLTDTTISLRRRAGNQSVKVLIDKGDMLASLQSIVAGNTVEVSMQDPAGVHQEGNPSNRVYGGPLGPLPQRKIFPFQGEEVMLPDDWGNQIGSFFSQMIKGDFE